MDARLYDTATDFGRVAHWVYRRDPVLFTGELTALRSTRGVTDGVFLSVDDCDGAVGAALQLPGDALLVSGLPPAMAKAAAVEVSAVRAALPGIRGTRGTAMAFADAWCSVTGAHAAEAIGRTLYGLDELVPPTGVPGASRIAGAADAELLFDWLDGFFVDAFDAASDREARRGYLADIRADGGHVVLWSVDGVPVSMARVHAPAAGMCRIGPVYTPAASRGRGFGAAVTAAAVRHAHRRGARHVVLFADVANPGANRIYRRLGFVPVADSLECAFTA
ncbi:MAG TPA: GNAT family N-acetyltransferase [Asanoa sp.]|nr:GNAT family N-acetyltransferase [Asanoa sp.]